MPAFVQNRQTFALFAAAGAGLMWGLVFITPLLLAGYPSLMLSFGRYTAFGLIALLPAYIQRSKMLRLTRHDWMMAFKLSLVGNIIYFAALATAIQLAGAPLPTLIIGTLPVVIAMCSNLTQKNERIAWSKLLLPLMLILAGLMLVNFSELQQVRDSHSLSQYLSGIGFACIGLIAWTWYPIKNSAYLKAQPQISSSVWSTAQGLAGLPLSLIGLFVYGYVYAQANPLLPVGTGTIQSTGFDFPFGAQPEKFIFLMLMLGFCASWLGTLLWNYACQKLPSNLSGQLIVFETLAALLYTFILRQSLPGPMIACGIALLCGGVILAVMAFQTPKPMLATLASEA